MPAKRISDCGPAIHEVTNLISEQLASSRGARNNSPLNCLAIIIMVLFLGMVSFQVAENINEKFTVSDQEAKTCLIDFQTKLCNPLELSEECKGLYSCIQKEGEDETGIGEKTKFLMETSLKELQ